MDIKLLVDGFGVLTENVLALLFFYVVLGDFKENKKQVCLAIIGLILLKTAVSYYFQEAWIKSAIAIICYYGFTCNYSEKQQLKKLTMAIFLWLFNVAVEYSVLAGMISLPNTVYVFGENGLRDYCLGLAISKSIVLLIILFLLGKKHQRREPGEKKNISYRWYLAFLIYPVASAVIIVEIYYLLSQLQTDRYNLLFITGILLIGTNMAIFLILNEMQRLVEAKLRGEITEQQLLLQEKHYRDYIEKNRTLKKYMHDLKNYLYILQGYVQKDEKAQALEHLKKMLDNTSNQTVEYTGNIAIDTILSAKIQEAQNRFIEIKPTIALYGTLNVKTMDLVLLLGNALDNAIEATEHVQTGDRKIYVTLRLQGEILHLFVKNAVQSPVVIENDSIKTKKPDADSHGFGLDNMRAVMQKYNGTMDIRCIGKWFILNIVLENEDYD